MFPLFFPSLTMVFHGFSAISMTPAWYLRGAMTTSQFAVIVATDPDQICHWLFCHSLKIGGQSGRPAHSYRHAPSFSITGTSSTIILAIVVTAIHDKLIAAVSRRRWAWAR